MLKKTLNSVSAQPDHYRSKWLFWAMLATLGSFFVATLLVYIIQRTQAFLPIRRVYEPLVLPTVFWPSTILLIATSLFLERSIWFIRRERVARFRRNLWYALFTAIAFCAVQPIGIYELVAHHFSSFGVRKFYGLSSVLIIVHALHVVGGLGYLGYLLVQTYRGKYDHERHWAVSHCAGYWHFLDLVWFAMVFTFLYTR